MKDFLALVRDTAPIKNPAGTWRYGRNMVLTKGDKSIVNEDGMELAYLVNGTVIGFIVTTKHIVYLSKNEDGTDEVGYVNSNNDTPVYTTVIKSTLFNFQYNCPIEGIFIYNYKDELIVSWCDGVKGNSNTPKLVNLFNPLVELNGNKELIDTNEFNKLHLFPKVEEGTMLTENLEGGNIDGWVAYITYAYVLDDKSVLPYFSSNNIVYLGKGYDLTDKQGIRITLTELDTNFNKLKIGLVIKNGGELFGYESYSLDYIGTEKTVDITDLSGYISSTADSIILEKTVFTKMNTITKEDNQVKVGNVEVKEEISFQKYANLLTLKPFRYLSKDPQVASLLPDEVYAINIQVQDKETGLWSNAFHIPGRVAEGDETNDLTASQISDYSLQWTTDKGYKQFHIFNNGSATTNVATDKMGYWENEETYPNLDEFNSTLDYEENPLPGTDLRNTPIRYHRMPSIRSNFEAGDTNVAKGQLLSSLEIEEQYYKLGVQVDNFDTVIPQELKDKIQAYRIVTVKRNNGNNYVMGNWAIVRKGNSTFKQDEFTYEWDFYDLKSASPDFTNSRVLGTELFKLKPTLDLSYIIANYEFVIGNAPFTYSIPTNDIYAEVLNNLRYIPENNIPANTRYLEGGVDINFGTGIVDTPTRPDTALNVTAFSFKKNVYSGFKNSEFIVLGRTKDFSDEIRFKGGDVFNECEFKVGLHNVLENGSTDRKKVKTVAWFKGLFSPLNSIKIELESRFSTDEITIAHSDADNVDTEFLVSQDYSWNYYGEDDLSSVHNINTILTFDYEDLYIDKFPYRIHRGQKIANENLNTTSLRTFLSADYYEMPNDKGEIVALRGKEKALFIQMRYALFTATIKDKLVTQDSTTYLGQSDLFDRAPIELLSDSKGFIGCTSKFASVIIKGMYIVVNQVTGQIFIVRGDVKEITKYGNKNWFWDNWDIGLDYYELDSNNEKRRIDNPYISVGHLIGYDKEFDRLLFTKKSYKFIGDINEVTFDGEFYKKDNVFLEFTDTEYFEDKSITLSYNLDGNGGWAFDHDYFPNGIYHSFKNLFSFTNKLTGTNRASIYKHNIKDVKGLFYGNKFESYVDLVFNGNSDTTKLYQSILWITDVINNERGNEYFKTITHLALYTSNQCSGIINLKDNHFDVTRNAQNEWKLNDFRDLVINENDPILDESGDINESNLNKLKIWFDKSNIISKFITVRLIVDNIDNDTVYIHEVKVKSIINKR